MGHKILIVDDVKSSRTILRNILKENYETIEVPTGEEALEQLEKHYDEIDIMMLDLMLPGISGFEVLERKKNSDIYNDIPVIIISGSSDAESQIRTFELGVNDYVTKPYDPAIVVSRVNNVLFQRKQMLEVKAQIEQLRAQAQIDGLTGLLNKTSVEKYMDEVLVNNEGKLDVMLVIDIDDFKPINDSYGHYSGDVIIKKIASTVAENFRKTDLIGRIGGDEFAVLMLDLPDITYARKKIDELLLKVKYNFDLSLPSLATISIGMASNDQKNTTFHELFLKADHSLYTAKRSGKSKYHEYGTPINQDNNKTIYENGEAVLYSLIYALFTIHDDDVALNCVTDNVQWVGSEIEYHAVGKQELSKLLKKNILVNYDGTDVRISKYNKQILGDTVVNFMFNLHVNQNQKESYIRMSIGTLKTNVGWKVYTYHASTYSMAMEKQELEDELDYNIRMQNRLLSNISGGIASYRIKRDGRIVCEYVSDGVARLNGFNRAKEFLDTYKYDVSESIIKEDQVTIKNVVKEAISKGDSVSAIVRCIRKNGEEFMQRLDVDIKYTGLQEDDIAIASVVQTRVTDEQAKQLSEQACYHKLLKMMGVAYWEWTVKDGYSFSQEYNIYAIANANQDTVWTVDEYKKYVHEEDVQLMIDFINQDKSIDNVARTVVRCKMQDGSYRWTEMFSFNEYDRYGELIHIISAMRDVDDKLVEQKKQYNNFFDALSNSSENIYLFINDVKGNTSKWSNNGIDYFGLPNGYEKDVLGFWINRIHPDDRLVYIEDVDAVFAGKKERHNVQYRVKNKYGDYVWVECVGKMIKDEFGDDILFAGFITRLDNHNLYDPLTKKLTMHQFYFRSNHSEKETVMLIGMDNFRNVIHNSSYEAADDMLIALANELEKPDLNQTVYRMSGDEFLVVIPDISPVDIDYYFTNVLSGFQDYCVEHHFSRSITFSGASEYYDSVKFDRSVLLKRLEHTMAHAKKLGGGRMLFFSNEIENHDKELYELSLALEKAIDNNFEGFEVYYQPIVSIKQQRIDTVEALLRFHNDEFGWVSPSKFIPMLEDNRLIIQIGKWVMEQVIHQNKLWNQGNQRIITGFNVSYFQLYNNLFVDSLIDEVNRQGVDPTTVCVELTESCKIQYPDMLSTMFERLLSHGFRLALDDFGVENSNLSILKDIPVTTVKIDHSFVRTLSEANKEDNKVKLSIVDGVVRMCKNLGYDVVAEGIETKEIANIMADIGADKLQGYYYSKPVDAKEVEKLFYKIV